MKKLVMEWLKATGKLVSYPFVLVAYWIAYAVGYIEATIEHSREEREVDYTYEKFGETYKF